MTEYIEREAVLRYLNDIWLTATPMDFMPDDDRQLAIVRCMGINDAMDAVKDAPAADVAPVVRCGECKHRHDDNFCGGRGWPEQLVPDDGYCDCGARREGDGNE